MQIFENNSTFYGARAAIGRSGWNRIDMLIGVYLHSGCLGYAFVVVVKMGKTFPPLSRSPKLLRMTFPRDFLVFWRCRIEQRLCWCGAAPNFIAKHKMKWDLSMQQTVKNSFMNLWLRKNSLRTKDKHEERCRSKSSRTPPTKTFSWFEAIKFLVCSRNCKTSSFYLQRFFTAMVGEDEKPFSHEQFNFLHAETVHLTLPASSYENQFTRLQTQLHSPAPTADGHEIKATLLLRKNIAREINQIWIN